MDPLSEILSLLKPRSYITAGFDAGGDWSLRLDDLKGRIKCYAVVSGSCWLSLEDGGEAIELAKGDSFVLPSGRPVRIGSDPALTPTLASEALSPDRNGETVTYNGGGSVMLVGSRFEANGRHTATLLSVLPPVMLLRGSADQAALRWSIEQMMKELREGRPGADVMAQHLANMMLVHTLRLYLNQQGGSALGRHTDVKTSGLRRPLTNDQAFVRCQPMKREGCTHSRGSGCVDSRRKDATGVTHLRGGPKRYFGSPPPRV